MTSTTDIGATGAAPSRGVLLGCAASFAFIIGGHFIYPASAPVSDAIPDRLTCYLPYLAAMAAPLMIALLQVSSARISDTRNSDSSLPRNILEQMVPALFVHLALLATLPYDWLNIAPLMALWFVIVSLASLALHGRGIAARAFNYSAMLAPTIAGALAVPVLSVWNAIT